MRLLIINPGSSRCGQPILQNQYWRLTCFWLASLSQLSGTLKQEERTKARSSDAQKYTRAHESHRKSVVLYTESAGSIIGVHNSSHTYTYIRRATRFADRARPSCMIIDPSKPLSSQHILHQSIPSCSHFPSKRRAKFNIAADAIPLQ